MKKSNSRQAEKKIRKYIIGGKGVMRVFAWIFAVATVLLLLRCTAFRRTTDVADAVPFDPTVESDDYVYLDVVGVSSWICKYTTNNSYTVTYYAAEDVDGYLYILKMTPADYAKLAVQHQWWDSDKTGSMPKPYRLYGSSSHISADKLADCADSFVLGIDEFKDYFGTYALDVGSSPAEDSNAMFVVFTGICGLACLAFAYVTRYIFGGAKRALKLLRKRGELEQAAAELESSAAMPAGMDIARVTEHYVFGKSTGSVISYDDILRIYTSNVYNKGRVAASSVMVSTIDKKRITAASVAKGDASVAYIDSILSAILQHKSDVIVGWDKATNKAYAQLVKELKTKKKQ